MHTSIDNDVFLQAIFDIDTNTVVEDKKNWESVFEQEALLFLDVAKNDEWISSLGTLHAAIKKPIGGFVVLMKPDGSTHQVILTHRGLGLVVIEPSEINDYVFI